MDVANACALEVCTDCVLIIANGEGPVDENGHDASDAHAAKMFAVWGDATITLGALDCEYCPTPEGGDCESWFSWRTCEGCGSPLGGDRHHATAWPHE